MRLGLDADRLLPIEPAARAIARRLYDTVSEAPILSPHGHVDARLLLDDLPFSDPVELLVRHDHYVTRLLHAAGTPLERLGLDPAVPVDPREVWRIFCRDWRRFAGTASGYWLSSILVEQFGIDEQPEAGNADALYDAIATTLATPAFRPRALFERFGIEVLATTDDPLDELEAHRALAADPSFRGRVIPTFRPDASLDPESPGFGERIERLGATSFAGYLDTLAARRTFFVENGAVSADHGVLEPYTADLDDAEASRLFEAARAGTISAAEARAFRGRMLLEMARMSVDDGLVMTIHAGVLRNHHQPTFERFGPDTGHDIQVATEWVRNLRPLLQCFGADPRLHLILCTVDETTYSRELAPLAAFYPAVFLGAPWWFLDAPDAVLRFRAAATETAGFYRGSGFVDDTRAFLSIPARHDMARRLDAAFLARLVGEGRLDEESAMRAARDLVDAIPRTAWRL
ncbi:MAG TPA: glucuronate isomerase [Pseudolysinimonas sp.]|nr:glucuronate isomerase [Pseudolysinimonas sp.]